MGKSPEIPSGHLHSKATGQHFMRTKHILLIILGVILLIVMVVVGFTLQQANEQQLALSLDLQYRTRLLADSLKESVEPNYGRNSTTELQKLVDKFANREHIVGLAIYDNRGVKVAASADLPQSFLSGLPLISKVMDSDKTAGEFIKSGGKNFYVLVEPIHQVDRVIGAFLVAQNAGYIDSDIRKIWENNLLRLLIQIIIFTAVIALLVRWIVVRPVMKLVESVKAARVSGNPDQALQKIKEQAFFKPLVGEIFKITKSLSDARFSASEEARMRLEKLDTPWTAERLKEFVKAYLKDQKIFLVFILEPYEKYNSSGEINYRALANGVSTAFEPLMEACGGTWIAQGSDDTLKETASKNGATKVNHDDHKYKLKRVWLNGNGEEKGYNKGYSVEGLYPLCLNTHTRPTFREEDWLAYKRINGKFAEVLLAEIKNVERPIIIINEYYFTLLPKMIKASRPDARVGIFWHTPWPSAEAFSICPQRKEILEGMLGADIIGFNTQQFCNNFIDTIGKNVESLIDFEKFSIARDEHTSYIRSFPISIAFGNERETAGSDTLGKKILNRLKIKTKYLGFGVDRLDYAKGIPERFKGIEYFLDTHPEYREQFTFLQIAAPDRPDIKKYIEYKDIVSREAERINKKFGTKEWQPIVLEMVQYNHPDINSLYKLANVCVVTSLHDSMNLVCKEYVAERNDELGVLILSQFTGAAHDLKGALVINPYSTKEIADAIYKGITMTTTEQKRRMKTMRNSVRNYNIYRWAAELLKGVADLG